MIFAIAANAGLANAQNSKTDGLDHQLLNAVFKGDLASVRMLLDNGADVEAKDANGSTPLVSAAEYNDLAMVKLLLEKGANVRTKDRGGETALINAARSGNSEIVGLLLQKTSDAKEKKRALFAAVHGSGIVIVQSSDNANESRASQTSRPRRGPPHVPWVRTVKLLLGSTSIETRDENGSTPLVSAAAYGAPEIVEFLLKRGADIQAIDKYGNTALIAAACECALATMNSTYDIVKMLLNKGADPNARNREGTTALMNAASGFGGAAIVELLLESGADPTAKDKHGTTALALAIKRQRPDEVRLLKRAMVQTH